MQRKFSQFVIVVSVQALTILPGYGKDLVKLTNGFDRTLAAHSGSPWGSGSGAARAAFAQGVSQLNARQYSDALISFRQAALADPETPHLAQYMLRAEYEVHREEVLRAGFEADEAFNNLVSKGGVELSEGRYKEAQADLKKALELEPTNTNAIALLTRAEDEPLTRTVNVPHNPASAQKHYEAGLVAYAKNQLEEAKSEWIITCRLDKSHPKAAQALKRVDEEIMLEDQAAIKRK